MVLIEEIDPSEAEAEASYSKVVDEASEKKAKEPAATAEEPAPPTATGNGGMASDPRTSAFLRACEGLDLSDEDQVKMQGHINDLKDLHEKMASATNPSGVKSCVREGWWYESGEESGKEADFGMSRLQSIAKASGDNAAKACEWDGALEHYFSAMEIAWKRRPGGSEELGTIHSNCSLCCLKLDQATEALDHADSATRMRPKWAKAHGRRAAALEALGRLADACDAFAEADKYAETTREKSDFEASRQRVEGSGDDGRLRWTPRPMPMASAGSGGGAEGEEGSVVAPPSARVDGDDDDDDDDDDDEDIGEPLGEPVTFEPSHASIVSR